MSNRSEAESAIRELFETFDTDSNGFLSFKELVHMLKLIAPKRSFAYARVAAVEALLEFDYNADRHLDELEFHALVTKVAAAAGLSVNNACERMRSNMSKPMDCTDEDIQVQEEVEAGTGVEATIELLADRRLHALFDLLDADGDGSIDFKELCLALRKLENKPLPEVAASTVRHLLQSDSDKDQKLDKAEFAQFMQDYLAKHGEHTFSDIVDTLIASASQTNSIEDVSALDLLFPRISATMASAYSEDPQEQDMVGPPAIATEGN